MDFGGEGLEGIIILGSSFGRILDVGQHSFDGLVGRILTEAIAKMREGLLCEALAIKDETEVVASVKAIGLLLNSKGEIILRLREKIGVYTNSAETVEGIDVFGVELQNPLIDRSCGLETAWA